MEKPKLVNSEDILKKAEVAQENWKERGKNATAALERLSIPFKSEISEDGVLVVDVEEQKLRVTMESPEERHREDVNFFREYLSQKSALLLGECKKITSLILEYNEVDAITLEADVFSLIPEGYTVLYFPDSTHQAGTMRWHDKMIAITGDITTPLTLATLLHEMGHAVDCARLQEIGVASLVTEHENKKHAERLRGERVASAFALAILRRCLRDDAMKADILTFLKDDALQSYYDHVIYSVQPKLADRHTTADWGDYERLEKQEADDRMYSGAWEEWKNTQAYTVWKDGGEYPADTKSDDEFFVWRSWVEETGYEFWKDLPEEESEPDVDHNTMEMLWDHGYENIRQADISNYNRIFFATKNGERVFIKKYARSKEHNADRINAELLSYQNLPPEILIDVIEINTDEEYLALRSVELQDIKLTNQSIPEILEFLGKIRGVDASFAPEVTWDAYKKVFEKIHNLQSLGFVRDANQVIQLFEQNRSLIESAPQVFSHHDFNARNFKKLGDQLVTFDFEYAGQDNALVDLATLYIDVINNEPLKNLLLEKARDVEGYSDILFDLMIIRRCAILIQKYQRRDRTSEFFRRNITAFNEALGKYVK